MAKVTLGALTLAYPMPVFLVGANVDGKPNFLTAAWGGNINGDPPTFAVSLRSSRHTLLGITQNMAFSVNVPSVAQVKETDFCGITSGAKGVDKVKACGFRVFYGKLGNAPLIEQCPVAMECKVVNSVDLGNRTLFIGQIVETHVSEECLTDRRPDPDKIRPYVYVTGPAAQYRVLGEVIGTAYQVGKSLQSS